MASRPLNDFDHAAAAFIRATMAQKKLSQGEVAERSGIHINSFHLYYHGKRSIGLGDFESIMDVLDVPPEDAMREIKRIRATRNYSE